MITYEDQIKNEYFEWLYNYVCKEKVNSRISYRKLFMLLHTIDFDYNIKDDANRALDGIDLRNRYAALVNNDDIIDILDNPCTVLEMMVALAIRCEETIMDNPSYGDRTGQWFWSMMQNLGLNRMTDDLFNRKIAIDHIYTFMDRTYDPDGKGGLFYIRNCKEDLRKVSIWSQLCWYLNNFV